MRGTFFGCLRAATSKLPGDQRGNAMMLTAAALLPLLGIVGSAIDIGRAYMTQLRLQQACDAGVLAGRRAMEAGAYDDDDKAEANKMFNFNFPTGIYGSKNISFSSSTPVDASKTDVVGQAAAVLPTAIMYIFGKPQFDLSANCTAKLEIANVDVMLVLDVTGSMQYKASDSDTLTKIAGLRAAAKSFFATMASADTGGGQIRFGVVPYSTTVNVGKILRDADSSWLSTKVTLPSRRLNNSWLEPGCRKNCKTIYEYEYLDREFQVGSPAPGSDLTFDTGSRGANVTAAWAGCIIERQTTPFGPTETAPSDAYDMNIDMVPDSSDATKWKLSLPSFAYNRGQVDPFMSTSNFGSMASAACPYPAMKMKKVVATKTTDTDTEIGETAFGNYIDKLMPGGNTYHNVGMAWGARLISPSGLFAATNKDTPGKPVSRHIIFMTDGETQTNPADMSHEGVEQSMPRIGSTSVSDSDARHNNRFVQLCRSARQKGITIWVVSFGIGTNANLDACASSGKALEASDSSKLNTQFQAIARQISKLRLSQ